MRMEIRSRNRVSFKLRDSIERRLRFVLARFAGRVSRVTVLLRELNRAHGRMAKHCKIVVQLDRSGQVCVEDTDADFQSAADRATGRIGRAVHRELDRRHAATAAIEEAANSTVMNRRNDQTTSEKQS
jgi:ribosome-associated translation inhibitor RaiA